MIDAPPVLSLVARDRQAVRVAERVRVREIDDDEGRRLLRTVRRGTGSVVTWRRARTVLGGHLFSTHKDLDDLPRPQLRQLRLQEGPR